MKKPIRFTAALVIGIVLVILIAYTAIGQDGETMTLEEFVELTAETLMEAAEDGRAHRPHSRRQNRSPRARNAALPRWRRRCPGPPRRRRRRRSPMRRATLPDS